jgi:hypothetical protein
MEKKMLFGGLSLISFLSILFMPADSSAWIYLLILGIIFAIGWYKLK